MVKAYTDQGYTDGKCQMMLFFLVFIMGLRRELFGVSQRPGRVSSGGWERPERRDQRSGIVS